MIISKRNVAHYNSLGIDMKWVLYNGGMSIHVSDGQKWTSSLYRSSIGTEDRPNGTERPKC